MKKIFFAILFLFILPSTAFAFERRSGDFVNISSDEVIEGSLFVNASILDIDGVVNGDVFCISPEVEISGTVNGDIICAGENFNMSGTSTGDVRIIFQKIKLDGSVNGNVNVIAETFEVQNTAEINGEVFVLSNNAILAGEIRGDLYGGVKEAYISSFVGGDISLSQGNGFFPSTGDYEFKLLSGATVEGDFNLKSKWDISREEGVVIKGEENIQIFKEDKINYSSNLFWALVTIFANILVSFVLIALLRNFVVSVSGIVKEKNMKSIWFGLLIFVLFPISFILLLLTMIGIPLAVILLFVFIGIALISKSIVSIVLGEKVLILLKSKKKDSLNLAAIFGAIIFYFIASLSFIGSFLSFLSMIIVFGAVTQYFRRNLSK